MKQSVIALLLILSASGVGASPAPTLILMGGSYRTCSSLLSDDCLAAQREFPGARGAPQYRITPSRFAEILEPDYWQARHGAPKRPALQTLLDATHAAVGDRLLDAESLRAAFQQTDSSVWNALLTQEQDLILSAFEQLQQDNGIRKREQVRIDGGNRPFDAAMFRQLVAEAAKRSPGRKPRVAFTTSASVNGFDAVDFYRELFRQAGAEPVWWPVDAALAEARFGGTGGCQFLPAMRRKAFSMLGRERVFPDLDAEQKAACADPQALDAVPDDVQAIFLDGGDQWLHYQTFFTRDRTANPWLRSIRAAFQRGDLVVAGTSAGAAIQSGKSGMITNGTSVNALARGAIHATYSMPEGCDAAHRCPPGVVEDDLTWWHGGGLDLIGPLLVDTHVAERRRELRLLTLLEKLTYDAETPPLAGIGLDETSALIVRVEADGLQLEAQGQSGVWWFSPPSPRTDNGSWTARANYLAPGLVLHWRNGNLQLPDNVPTLTMRQAGIRPGGDALQPETLREAVWRMARDGYATTDMAAPEFYRLRVKASTDSRTWQGPQGQQGITGLIFEFGPGQ